MQIRRLLSKKVILYQLQLISLYTCLSAHFLSRYHLREQCTLVGKCFSNAYQAISRLPVAHLGSPVALAAPGLSDKIDHDGRRGGGVLVPPVKTDAGILARRAVVFRRALADLNSSRQRWRVCRHQNGGVERSFQQSEQDTWISETPFYILKHRNGLNG